MFIALFFSRSLQPHRSIEGKFLEDWEFGARVQLDLHEVMITKEEGVGLSVIFI